MTVRFELNGKQVVAERPPEKRLDILRDDFGRKSNFLRRPLRELFCSSDNERSVMYRPFLSETDSFNLEGFVKTEDFKDIENGFRDSGYTPCEFCKSSKYLSVHALIEAKPDPDEKDIEGILGNTSCTCGDISGLFHGIANAAIIRKRRMRAKEPKPHIYTPKACRPSVSLHQCLSPSYLLAVIYTWKIKRENTDLSQSVISLSRVWELQRISRTERFMEIGAMVPLNRILSIGKLLTQPCSPPCPVLPTLL